MKLHTFVVKAILTLILVLSSTSEIRSGIDNRDILVGASARALGMGSAFTAGPAGSDSFYWNPSSLGFLNGMEFSLVGLPFAENLTNREGAFSIGLNPEHLGISTRKIGNISLASWFDGWGEDRERNRIMLLGYGYSIGKSVATGVNIRHHRRSRDVNTHLGWSYDFGIQVSRKLTRLGNQIAFGLSFEDLDGRLYGDGQLLQDLPLVVRFGAAYHLDRATILSSDFTLHNDDQLTWKDRFRAHLGVEKWIFNRRFGIRFGYTAIANYDRFIEGEWSRGFSFRSDTGRFDYAYLNGGKFDEGSHWIAATFRWNGIPNAAPTVPPGPPAPILMPNPSPHTPKTIDPVSALNENETDFRVSERLISPNDDGVKDITSFRFTIPENTTWTLEVHDEAGTTVKRYSGTGLQKEALLWNGQDDAGNLVSDGTYTAQLTVLDLRNYQYFQREATVEVNTIPTDFEVHAEPPLIESSSDVDTKASSSDARTTNTPVVNMQTPNLNRGDENTERQEEPTDEEKSPPQHKATEQKPEDSEVVLTLPGIAFDTGSYEISDGYRAVLEKFAKVILMYPKAQVSIEGHTDSIGDADYNLELSHQRADAVKDYLVREFGISWARLKTKGYGEEKPIVDNDVESIRHKNRRVEVVLSISGTLALDADMISEITNRVKETSSEISELNLRLSAPSTEDRRGKWTLMVSSFKSRESAELLVENLKTLDIAEFIEFSRVVIKSQPWYRVTVGRFKERAEAAEFADELRESQGIEPLVISLE